MTPDRPAPPLAADDPRLSEWLDGRLPVAEAAEIARAVAASPELSRLVEDLRGIKKSLAALPASPPPASFVDAVMAALDAGAVAGADGPAVEAEWRKIERERLEGEIAEAREDAAGPAGEPMRHRWPWLALAGALAAGVLVAVVINRPPLPGEREVALAARRADGEADRPARKADASEVADRWLEDAAAGDAAARASAGEEARRAERAGQLVDKNQAQHADGDLDGTPAERLAEAESLDRARAAKDMEERQLAAVEPSGRVAGGFGGGGRGAVADNEPARERAAAASVPAGRIAAPPAAQEAGDAATELRSLAAGASLAPYAEDASVRVVRYRIRTAADRARLDELVAASVGREALRQSLGNADALPKAEAERDAADAKLARGPQGGKGAPGLERIEVSAPAAEITALIAALEAAAPREPRARLAKPGEALWGRGQQAGQQPLGEPENAALVPGAPKPAQEGEIGESSAAESGPAPLARPDAKPAAAANARSEVVRLVIEVVDESGIESKAGTEAAEGGP